MKKNTFRELVRTQQILDAALAWIEEHIGHDPEELGRVLRDHLGMTEEEIKDYGFDL